jgi:hypothetical protein
MTTSATITKIGRILVWRKKRLRTEGRRRAPPRLATLSPYRALAVCIIAITLQPELAPGNGPLSQQTVIDRTVRLFAYLWHAPGPFVIAVA